MTGQGRVRQDREGQGRAQQDRAVQLRNDVKKTLIKKERKILRTYRMASDHKIQSDFWTYNAVLLSEDRAITRQTDNQTVSRNKKA